MTEGKVLLWWVLFGVTHIGGSSVALRSAFIRKIVSAFLGSPWAIRVRAYLCSWRGLAMPIALAMILVNGVSTKGTFFAIGAFYIAAGLYYGVTVPVQPMKTIGAYAIAMGMTATQVTASGLLIGGFLLFIGLTGVVEPMARLTPRPVVRGVQVSVGVLLMVKGFELMLGSSPYQKLFGTAEPYLRIQAVGTVPIGLLLGCSVAFLIFFLLDNKKVPAGLVAVGLGLVVGAFLQGLVSIRTRERVGLCLVFVALLPLVALAILSLQFSVGPRYYAAAAPAVIFLACLFIMRYRRGAATAGRYPYAVTVIVGPIVERIAGVGSVIHCATVAGLCNGGPRVGIG